MRTSPIASGVRPATVVQAVITMGRRRSRPAWTMAAWRSAPWRCSWKMRLSSTMPLFTTMPASSTMPIIAIIVSGVPVAHRKSETPTAE